jgi:serine/threonine-protein kinase RsbW
VPLTRLELEVPARPEYLVLGRLALAGIARVRPVDLDTLSDLKLALTEACSNSMRHAYEAGPGRVQITFELGDGQIAVAVSDDGPGFEEPAIRFADANEIDEGGLGLSIIRAITDDVQFGQRDDRTGSCVRFVKRLD